MIDVGRENLALFNDSRARAYLEEEEKEKDVETNDVASNLDNFIRKYFSKIIVERKELDG